MITIKCYKYDSLLRLPSFFFKLLNNVKMILIIIKTNKNDFLHAQIKS